MLQMKIVVQNLVVEYQDEGADSPGRSFQRSAGKTILFLHGWQDNLHTFDALAKILAGSYRIVRLDLPGFGQSETPQTAWNLDDYIECVKSFIEKQNLQIDALAGHSFGGRIIIKGVSEKKFQEAKIILINAAGVKARQNTLRNALWKATAKIGGLVSRMPPFSFFRENLRKKVYNNLDSDYPNTGALKETFVKVISEDLSASAKKIVAPTLLIWGENDTATPLSDGQRLAQLIPNAKLEIIEGAGHFVHQEKPKEVAELIKEFVNIS